MSALPQVMGDSAYGKGRTNPYDRPPPHHLLSLLTYCNRLQTQVEGAIHILLNSGAYTVSLADKAFGRF